MRQYTECQNRRGVWILQYLIQISYFFNIFFRPKSRGKPLSIALLLAGFISALYQGVPFVASSISALSLLSERISISSFHKKNAIETAFYNVSLQISFNRFQLKLAKEIYKLTPQKTLSYVFFQLKYSIKINKRGVHFSPFFCFPSVSWTGNRYSLDA